MQQALLTLPVILGQAPQTLADINFHYPALLIFTCVNTV